MAKNKKLRRNSPNVFLFLAMSLFLLIPFALATSTLTNGIVSAYDFSQTSGNLLNAVDNSLNRSYYDYVMSKSALGINGLSWNSSGNNFPNQIVMNKSILNGMNKTSIFCWIYPRQEIAVTNLRQSIFYGTATSRYASFITFTPTGLPQYRVTTGYQGVPDDEYTITGATGMRLSNYRWNFVGMTFDGMSMYAFKNNSFVGSIATSSRPLMIDISFKFFDSCDGGCSDFFGNLDECYIWNRNLSVSEITELYNSGTGFFYPFNPPKPPYYSNFINNATSPARKGNTINFSVNAFDDIALSYYQFADNQSGIFLNRSAVTITGLSAKLSENLNVSLNGNGNICAHYTITNSFNYSNQTLNSCFDTAYLLNITAPLNNSYHRENPVIINITTDLNYTNCSLYSNFYGAFKAISSYIIGYVNVTSCYNQTNYINGSTASNTIGAYNFENNLLDSSPYGKNGSGVGSYSYLSSKGSNQTGNLSLSLTGGYINLGNNFDFERTDAFSVAMWIYPSAVSGYPAFIGKRVNSGIYRGYIWFIDSGVGKMAVQLNNDAGSNTINLRSATTNILANVWQFVVMTYDGSSDVSGIKLYYNAVPETITSLSNTLSATMKNNISAQFGASDASLLYSGRMDNIYIYNYVLTQTNISYLYDNGLLWLVANTSSVCNTTQILQNSSSNISFSDYIANNTLKSFAYYANCSNNFLSNYANIRYDSDFTAPIISVSYPNQTYNETYPIDLYINFTTNEYAVCSLNLSNFTQFYSNGSVFSYNENTLTNNVYDILINCSDLSENYAVQELWFTKDKQYPYIYLYKPLNSTIIADTEKYLRINVTFADNRDLYYKNVTIYYIDELGERNTEFNDFSYISGSSYNYVKNLLFYNISNGTNYIELKTCDSHTSRDIPKADGIITDSNSITYQFGDTIIKITSNSGDEIEATTEKLNDRYTFEFTYSGENEKDYSVESNKEIKYLENSDINGHMIIDDRIWIDFAMPEQEPKETPPCDNPLKCSQLPPERNNPTLVRKENNTYHVQIADTSTDMKFQSIGFLNCISETDTFSKSKTEKSYPFDFAFDTNNISHAIFLFTLIILYLGVMTLGFVFGNVGFVGFGFLIGMVIGLILGTINLFFLLLFIFVNCAISIQFARTNKR